MVLEEEKISKSIIDGGGSGLKASIIESSTDPTKKGLVILNPDGSSVGSGGSTNDKGYFVDKSALTTAYPTGEAGWYAVVGETDTIWIWDTDTNARVDSGTSAILENAVPNTRTITINSTSYDLSEDRSWTVTAAPNPNTKRMLIQNM